MLCRGRRGISLIWNRVVLWAGIWPGLDQKTADRFRVRGNSSSRNLFLFSYLSSEILAFYCYPSIRE